MGVCLQGRGGVCGGVGGELVCEWVGGWGIPKDSHIIIIEGNVS